MSDKPCKTETPPVSCDLLPTVLLHKKIEKSSTDTSTDTTKDSDIPPTKDIK